METERQKQARRTKTKLYKSARKLIGLKGYESVKIAEICEDAGVSTGLFYNYYPNKAHIYLEGSHVFDRQVARFLQEHQGESARKRLFDLIEFYLDQTIEGKYLYTAYFIGAHLNESEQFQEELFSQFNRALLSMVEEMVAEGTVAGDPVEIKEMLLCFVNGVIRDWCLSEGTMDLKGYGRKAFAIVMSYYTPKTS